MVFSFFLTAILTAQNSPELIYYKFDGTGTTVPNQALTPVGTNPAPLTGVSQGPGGQFANGLLGTGVNNDWVDTGWPINLGTGSWTMSLYLSGIPSVASPLYYFFGETSAPANFRCFTGGAAGAGNLLLRSPNGTTSDVLLNGVFGGPPVVITYVFDNVTSDIKAYVNGVLTVTVPQATVVPFVSTGTLKVGGNPGNTSLPTGGVMDEFRLYNRALTAPEITLTWNQTLPFAQGPIDASLTGLVQPNLVNGGCFTNAEVISVNVANYGSDTLDFAVDPLIVTAQVTGPNPQTFIDTLTTGSILPGATQLVTLSSSYNMTGAGTYNFQNWVRFVTPGVDANPANDTLLLSLSTGITGNYTVNSALATGGTNFQSFSDLASVVNTAGVCGSVVVDVVSGSGPYTEQFLLGQIPGSSATNTLTIHGHGNTIQFLSTNTNERATVRYNGTDYVSMDSLTIKALGTQTTEFGWGVLLTNSADFNSFNACQFLVNINSTSTNYSAFVTSSSATSATTAGSAATNLTVTNCLVEGGYYCMVINGPTTAPFSTNNIISGNQIRDFYLYGMYVRGSNNSQISNNEIYRQNRGTISTTYMLYLTGDFTGTTITRNNIRNLAGTSSGVVTAYGVYGTGVTATFGQELLFSNNLISGFEGMNSTNYGMYLLTTNGIKIYHNSISLDNQGGGTGLNRALYHSGANSSIELLNNIFSVTSNSTGAKHVLYFATATAVVSSNFNVLHMGSTTGTTSTGFYNATTYSTLADWQTSFLDPGSTDQNPGFLNSAAGDLTPTNVGLNGIVFLLPSVPIDYYGVVRGALTDPGAIDFTPASEDLGVYSILAPSSPACNYTTTEPATFQFINRGFNPVNLAQVQATVRSSGPSGNSGPYTEILPAGTLAPGDTFTYTFLNTLNLATTGSYTVSFQVGFTPGSGLSDANPADNTDTLFTSPGTQGAYTINDALATGGTNFASFNDMVNSFTATGLCGPVVVTVAPGSGPYNEQVTIGAIIGMSAVNTITILGNGDTLTYLSTSSGARHTLKLDGATYVTVDSLVIISQGQTTSEYGWAVWLTNNADHNTFNACQFLVTKNSTSTNYTPFVTSSSATGATTIGAAASYLTVTNCVAEGGYYSMVINGATTAPFADSAVISNNQIRDFYLYGLYVRGQNNGVIANNEVYRTDRGTISTTYGIYLTSNMSNTLVDGNIIRDIAGTASTTAALYGIYGTGVAATIGQEIVIANNRVSGVSGMNGTQYGIYLITSNQLKIYHNTISLDHVSGSGTGIIRGLYHTGSAGGSIDVQNNIFSITTNSSGTKNCVYFATTTAAITSNYNVLHMGATTGSVIGVAFLGVNFTTLAAWQAGGTYDLNSVDNDPFFVNSSGGNLIPTSSALNNLCLPIAPITSDAVGTVRGANPDPGALEFTPLTTDIGVDAFASLTSGCGLSATAPVIVSVRNFGLDTVFTFQVSYQIGTTTVTETVNDTLVPGTAKFYTFTGTANLSVPGTYTLSAWTSVAGDLNFYNDSTLGYSLTHYPSITTLPYTQNFDSWTPTPVIGTPIISLPDNWINVQGEGAEDWTVRTGTTPSTTTGPSGDNTTGSGNYLYVEDSFTSDSVIVQTPCFDVSAAAATVFSFWYHSNNGSQPNNENFLHIDLLYNGGLYLDIIAPIGHKNNNWNFVEIDMSQYVGTFAVRFRVQNSSGLNHDIAIDDINLREVPPIDAGVADLYTPQSGCGLSAAELLQIGVENFGLDTLRGGMIANYQITGPVTSSGSIAVTDTLAPGDQALVTFPGTFNFSLPGDYTVTLWTTGPVGEGNTANDTLVVVVSSIPLVSTFPYYQDFESGNGGWNIDPNSTSSSWAFGTPAKSVINSASSGVNAWVTGGLTTGTYNADENSQVAGPCFNFSNLSSPVVELDVWWNSEFSWDGANLQSSLNGGATWQTIGLVGDPDNWYTDGTINGNPGGVQIGWSGRTSTNNGSNGWVTAKHDLTGLAGQSAVLLRIAFGADGSVQDNGFAFDNLHIYDRSSDDIGVTAVVDPSNLACSTDSLPITVTLTNFGTDTQVTVPVFVNFTSGPVALPTITGVFSGSLAPAASTNFLVGYANVLTAGVYNFKVYSVLAGDTLNGNDTLYYSVEVSQTPTAPTVFSASTCPTDSAQFTLVASNAPFAISWYDSAVGGLPIFVGDTFVTPFLNTSTTYFVEAGNSVPYQVGPLNNSIGTGANFVDPSVQGMFFTATTSFVLDSMTVYPQNAGIVVIRLRDVANTTTIATVSVPVSTGGLLPVRIPVGLTVQPGSYRIDGAGSTTGGLYRNQIGAVYPYEVPGIVSITGNTFDPAYFYYFYNWRITSVGCQSPRVPVTATFNAGITVDLGGDAVVCPGYTINGVTAGAVSYVWNGDPNVNTSSLSADTAGIYSLTVTNVDGCSASDTISLTLLPGPLVNLGPDQSACNQVVLDAGNPGSQYAWSVLGQNGQTVTVTTSGTYFVNVSASGCTDTDTIEVNILPGPVVDFGADSITCRTITLDAGNAGSTYLWSTGATTQTVTVTPPASISLVATSPNGCTDTDTLNVSLGANPVVDLGPDATICDSLLLNAGNPSATYVWSTGASSQSVIATQTGTYSVQVTSNVGCVGSDSVALVVNYSPTADFTFLNVSGQTFDFTNVSTSGSYLWDFGDGITSNLQSPTHTYAIDGTYEVTLIVTNECGSDTLKNVVWTASIRDDEFARLLQIYPNPSEGVFVVSAEGLSANTLTLEVMDLRGRSVSTQVLSNLFGGLNATVDLTNEAEGPYVLKVSDGTRHAYFRIVRL